jgi:hypothetical protein
MRYYGIDLGDVILRDRMAPRFVIALIRGLPDTSLFATRLKGGEDHRGWGVAEHILASIYDAVNQNTRATGNWGKKKPPKIDPFPKPKSKPKEKSRGPSTVADLYNRALGGLSGIGRKR